MRILLTGGAGFIGSNLVKYFLDRDEVKLVIVLDNLSTGTFDNLKEFSKNKKFKFILGDVSNLDTCLKVMNNDIDCICHQAALGSVPRSIKNPIDSHKSNVTGFLNILYSMYKFNIKRVVYASSSSVYGDNPILPKKEGFEGDLLSPYAGTKMMNEMYAKIFNKVYGLETIGLRYFNVFGPKQNPDGIYAAVIPKFISKAINNETIQIYGDGKQSRDFTYIDNVVLANWLALTTDNDKCFGKIMNVGCNDNITLNQLIIYIEQILKKKIKKEHVNCRKGDIKHSHADVSKLHEYLGMIPFIKFKEGLNKLIEYYLL